MSAIKWTCVCAWVLKCVCVRVSKCVCQCVCVIHSSLGKQLPLTSPPFPQYFAFVALLERKMKNKQACCVITVFCQTTLWTTDFSQEPSPVTFKEPEVTTWKHTNKRGNTLSPLCGNRPLTNGCVIDAVDTKIRWHLQLDFSGRDGLTESGAGLPGEEAEGPAHLTAPCQRAHGGSQPRSWCRLVAAGILVDTVQVWK